MKSKVRVSILTIELVVGAVLFGLLMCLVNSLVGYREFKKELETMYGNITVELAKTGASYINVDKIPQWLQEGTDEDWEETNQKLDLLTNTADLAYIYVSVISDNYKKRTYIFDTVNQLALAEGSTVIPFGKVSSLEDKDPAYIANLKLVLEEHKEYSSFTYKKEGGHVTTATPLWDSKGRVTAIMSIVKPITEVEEYRKSFLRSIVVSALVLTLVFIVLYAILLYMGIIRPILFITYETSHLVEHQGELTGLLKKIRNPDEIGKLANSVEAMSRDMNTYIEELTQATAEKERLGAELNVATQIQADMLPQDFPPYKDHPEIELFASMTPAKEVGGDFYDFYMIDDDHFAMVVGDVSGKGVPAALFMVITKTLLKDASAHNLNPAQIFEHVNETLCEGNESSLFVTCWMGILTLSTGELNFANAGHNAPLLLHKDKITYLQTKANLMLAGMEGTLYTKHSLTLQPGDKLFIYTDGITEATNSADELYGEERLLKVMEGAKEATPHQTLALVQKDIDSFVQGVPQFDDITMLAMAYIKDIKLKLTVKAKEEELDNVNDFIHSALPASSSQQLINEIDLAVEEIFVNIAHYAYAQENSDNEVLITCLNQENNLIVSFIDSGKPFNPLQAPDPDLTLSAQERDIGGLGIFLTKKFMDEVRYEHKGGKNILTIEKKV